jgi:hypothetical protein
MGGFSWQNVPPWLLLLLLLLLPFLSHTVYTYSEWLLWLVTSQ